MTISDTMDLAELRACMGSDATIAQAEIMRDRPSALYPGEDTADVSEGAWNNMLEASI